MPRIRLAYWHGDKQPGDEIEVTGDELAVLQRDGRVAEVLDFEGGGVLAPQLTESVNASSEAELVQAPPEAPEPDPEPAEEAEPSPQPAPSGRKRR